MPVQVADLEDEVGEQAAQLLSQAVGNGRQLQVSPNPCRQMPQAHSD